jgi:hypothetical protein
VPHVIAWCGFLGAWLLVAGPLDQAVRELEDQDFEHDAITRAATQVGDPPQVSSWWLLIPPVWYGLRQNRHRQYKHRVGAAMDEKDVRAFLSYRDAADAWITVAAGASLIAVAESWGLRESYGWPEWVWAGLVMLMLVICGMSTKYRRHRRLRHSATD